MNNSSSKVQEKLQAEAQGIVNELGILELLGSYGEARIVGSVAHKLIVKKDIDIHLLTNQDLLKVTSYVLDYLRNRNNKLDIYYEDFRHQKSSMFIGIKNYFGAKHNWYIDIWMTDKSEYTGFGQVEFFEHNLTEKQRKIILEIKEYYNRLDMLNDGFSSIIYEAVLNENIINRTQFEQYLRKKYRYE